MRARGARVRGVAMPRGGHTMLRGARAWHRTAAAAVLAVVDGGPFPAVGGIGSTAE
ncbi:hypothetical protein NKH77_04855 [Streptomyces sp. M19]